MKILIVEDEKPLAESVKALLEKQGFEAECVYDGLSGLEYARSGGYDLLILDVMLPGLDGRAVAERVRAGRCGTPILMLTALSGVDDRVAGLDAGADYYLAKPFDSRELSCTLVCGEKTVQLSAKEFEVMRFLLSAKNGISSKEAILAKVWGHDSNAVENHVEVYVGFLRKKLASIGSNLLYCSYRIIHREWRGLPWYAM